MQILFLLKFWTTLFSDSVTRVNDSTRLEPWFLVTLTRITLRKMVTRLASSHVFHRMTRLDLSHNQWLETRVRVIFAESQSLWSTNPVRLHAKKWSFFGPVMIKIGPNFLLWVSSRVILYPKGQAFIICTEVDLRCVFHWGARRAQYRPIDTPSWSNQVFAYRDNGSRSHRLLSHWVFSRWSDLSYFNTDPMQKYTAQYNAYPNSCHCY